MRFQAQHLLATWTKMEAHRRGVRRHGVTWRSPVWSSAGAATGRSRLRREAGVRAEAHVMGEGRVCLVSRGAARRGTVRYG
jgi:hypothetical protein